MNSHQQALKIAVVGHTNTGKTSLLRTLSRDRSFGDVSAMPSTTRHVQVMPLAVGGDVIVELFDTPGLEEAIALLEKLDAQKEVSYRDGPVQIQALLNDSQALVRFEQEGKVLKQLLVSDAAVYVIDVRDPVLPKYRDEIAILARCGKPLLPLLNFVSAGNNHETQWRDALAQLGLHVLVSFDTVAPTQNGEALFYEKLATLLDARGKRLIELMAVRQDDAARRSDAACAMIAELLVDVATCKHTYVEGEQGAIQEFNERVRSREQRCVDAMLGLYQFAREDLDASPLPFNEGQWRDDLFDPRTLTSLGLNLSGGAAAGAAAGFGVDLMLGGASLGTGAAVGALMGGGLQTVRRFGRRVGNQLAQTVQGAILRRQTLRADNTIVQILLTRQILLLKALQGRGHAATTQVQVDNAILEELWPGEIAQAIDNLRQFTRWSTLYQPLQWSAERQAQVEELAQLLRSRLKADAKANLGQR